MSLSLEVEGILIEKRFDDLYDVEVLFATSLNNPPSRRDFFQKSSNDDSGENLFQESFKYSKYDFDFIDLLVGLTLLKTEISESQRDKLPYRGFITCCIK